MKVFNVIVHMKTLEIRMTIITDSKEKINSIVAKKMEKEEFYYNYIIKIM